VSEVIPGRIYRHFKGELYFVIGLAKHTESEEEFVIYQKILQGKLWARPVGDFMGTVVYGGKTFARFELESGVS
jgi:hypothetical protein